MGAGILFIVCGIGQVLLSTQPSWWHSGQVFALVLFALGVGFCAYSAGRTVGE